jgi:CHAD domain-containing protein
LYNAIEPPATAGIGFFQDSSTGFIIEPDSLENPFMQNDLKFKMPDGHNSKQFIGKLAAQYALKKEPTIAEKFTICDTFDWRLFDNSLVLYASANRIFLRKLAADKILHSAEIASLPAFIWDFPESELKRQLAPILKMRILLKLVEVQCRSVSYRILNTNQKTVAWLAYEEFRQWRPKNKSPLVTHLWLKSVKGYPKYLRMLARQFQEAGLEINKREELYFKALEVAGKKPGDYSAKVNIQLDPEMRSDQATKVILRLLRQIMRINEAYLDKDLDTEFLHDFRVAIRRMRSAVGQIKYVFPAKTTARIKKDFAYVGKLSNELRDLDVYLLKEKTYKAMLPPILRADIDPLFDHLRKKRSRSLEMFIRALKAKKYAKIMNDWEIFLNKPLTDSAEALNAKLPIIDLARTRIHKKYRSVVKAGKKILKNTEDEMLHVLRIHCKKLRYLMEFFSSLFPSTKISTLIGQLKKLQDNLGDFNDLRVQRDYLLDIIEELPMAQPSSKRTFAAIGSLVGALDKEKQTVKDAFTKTFKDFESPANRALFQELFTSTASKRVS